jgi:spermidine synthase
MVEYGAMHKEQAGFSFLAITACGFATAIGQIIILRELLVFFYGNELSTGLIFASWLLWTALGTTIAGRHGTRLSRNATFLARVLVLLAVLLPASILWIRAARIIWAIPRGEMLPPLSMLWISLAGTGFFCFFSGALFGLAWSSLAAGAERGSAQPLLIYLGEALGAAAGGLLFYFVLLTRATILNGTLLTALLILVTIAIVLGFRTAPSLNPAGEDPSRIGIPGRGRPQSLAAVMALIGVVAVAFMFSRDLDRLSRHWQWGPDLLTVQDTPFQNLALLKDANQFSLFANGLLFFSTPDPQNSEYAAHMAMLEYQDPRTVLLIGGGVGGLLSEVLKHPGVSRIDYVEPDPEVIELAEEFLPGSATAPLLDRRVHLFHTDASTFVRAAGSSYDVVIMQLGDPVNAEMNRFYTVEFFSRISRLLNQDGIFSFAITSSPDMVGPAEARLLQSVYRTLSSVFPAVLVIPGENARFLASHERENLTTDPQELISRIASRKLDLQFVREYYLFDYLNPMRLDYLQAILSHTQSVPVNKDFEPTCYFNNLLVWTAQIHPFLGEAFLAISRVGRPLFWMVVAILAAGLLCLSRSSYGTMKNVVGWNVLIVGGVQMVLEIILLLGFQILEGFVYMQLALIISFFMTGLGLGAGFVVLLSSRIDHARRWLMLIQSVLAAYLVGVLGLFFQLQQHLQSMPQTPVPMSVIFSVLALAGGVLGGLHFSLGVQVASNLPGHSAATGAKLYALDLVGATAGVLVASLFILPVYGLTTTILALAVFCMAGVMTLARRPEG